MNRVITNLILCALALLMAAPAAQAQDPQYSQFYSNLVMLNPAFTGSGIGHRIAMNYRAQWVNIPGYYKQAALSYDQPLYFLGTTQGLGINLNYDRAGEGNLTKLNATVNYAYHLELTDDHYLHFGISGGITQASVDFYALRFPDQIDARNGFVRPTLEPGTFSQTALRPDVNAGIAYFNPYAWLGLTVNHITEPQEVFTVAGGGVEARLPRKYVLTGGLKIPLRDMRSRRDMSISPVFLYKMQGEFYQVDAGLYVNADPMVFGVWYRHRDAMIGLIGVKQGPFSFGYSFDYTISSLTQPISGGSHEVSVVFEFEKYRKIKGLKHRRLPCPRF